MTADPHQDTKRNRTGVTLLAVFVALSALAVGVGFALGSPALAQGFKWPWEVDEEPRRPVQRPPPQPAPDPYYRQGQPNDGGGTADGWGARSSICVDLERRLVQETANSGQGQNRLPQLATEIARLRSDVNLAESQLERSGCFEEFLFTRSLRRTPKCLGIARERDQQRQQLAQLEAEQRDLSSLSNRSYQDEIISELARNNCGDSYAQEARRRQRNAFNPFWDDGEGGSGYANSYRALPFATYRTLCVRLCDGYYFPVSFSTLPNHFDRDSAVCQSKCAAPATLYYHQNPGAGVEQMVAYGSNEPYTKLDQAFLYRKKYIDGCSCKQAEFVPQTPIPGAPELPVSPNPGDRADSRPSAISPYR